MLTGWGFLFMAKILVFSLPFLWRLCVLHQLIILGGLRGRARFFLIWCTRHVDQRSWVAMSEGWRGRVPFEGGAVGGRGSLKARRGTTTDNEEFTKKGRRRWN